MARSNIMLDIETLGCRTNAAIVSIGAVVFDIYGGISAKFHQRITPNPCAIMDFQTVQWWMQQSSAAQEEILGDDRICEKEALIRFMLWTPRDKPLLWTNGPMFDERILREAFQRHDMAHRFPFHYRDSRCVRTILDCWPQARKMFKIAGTKHNALVDACRQATQVAAVLRRIKCSG